MKKGYKKVSSFCTQSVQLKNVNIYCTKRPSSIFSLGDRNFCRQGKDKFDKRRDSKKVAL